MNTSPTSCPHATVDILGQKLTGLLDSGASLTATNATDLLKQLNLNIIKNKLRIYAANGIRLSCLGVAYIPYTFMGKTRVLPTAIIPEISKPLILGTDFWKAFNIKLSIDGNLALNEEVFNCPQSNDVCHVTEYQLNNFNCTLMPDRNFSEPENSPTVEESLDLPSLEIPTGELSHADEILTEHNLTQQEKQRLFEIIKEFPRTKNGNIGRTQLIQHRIVLTQNLNDMKHKKTPIYPLSPKVEKEVDKEIERLKNLDLNEECESDFINPLLPVKKGENKWRLCLDARRLNSITRDEYPFPNMSQILHRILRSKYFTTIDLKDAYHQVLLHPESRNLTAFRSTKGLFRYKKCHSVC